MPAGNFQVDANNDPILGVGRGMLKEMIQAYFRRAHVLIRIASAYFSVSGYKIGRKYVSPTVQFKFLVGKEDSGKVVKAIVEEIEEDLARSDEDLWEAVAELVQRMQAGQFRIVDARAMLQPFHSKFYVVDESIAWHGSANFSKRAIDTSIEQLGAIQDPAQIGYLISEFEDYFSHAQDLTERVIEILLRFLGLVRPFDIYLKTLLCLNALPETERRAEAHAPNYYQKGIIARALRQIEEWGGAFIVAATGLGKTVMGAEIGAQLLAAGKIKRMIVIGPGRNVRQAWEAQIDGRDIPCKYFTYSVLYRESGESHHQITLLNKELEGADARTLIVIDEAHVYRNQLLAKAKGQSRVFDRLLGAINDRKANILLLTATPYGTSIHNVNSLLHLLPHRLPIHTLFGEQHSEWSVQDEKQLARLPVCSVIGLPHVIRLARERGDVDEHGNVYIQRADGRQYFPKIHLYSGYYHLPLEAKMKTAFDEGCFTGKQPVYQTFLDDRGALKYGATDSLRNQAITAWLSSPRELLNAVTANLATPDPGSDVQQLSLDGSSTQTRKKRQWRQNAPPDEAELIRAGGGYHISLEAPLSTREQYLAPIQTALEDQLSRRDLGEDNKLATLLHILDERCQIGAKAVIFVTRYDTAVYLGNALGELRPALKVACTVGADGKLKPPHDRQHLLADFSYESNAEGRDRGYRLLVCTDADGEGINLQGANTVINYDSPKSATQTFQRAGRVIRMTEDPNRIVHLYTLIPEIPNTDEPASIFTDIKTIFSTLMRRHDASQGILGAPAISQSIDGEVVHFEDEINIEHLLEENAAAEAFGSVSGTVATPAVAESVLEKYREYAEKLPDNIVSARLYEGETRKVYVLIRHKSKYRQIIYDVSRNAIEPMDEADIHDLIRCGDSEPRAEADAVETEHLVNRAVQAWQELNSYDLDDIRKVCALYLVPQQKAGSLGHMLIKAIPPSENHFHVERAH